MPILKPISGHGSTGGIRRYLEKGGRALARDLFNLSYDERDAGALGEDAKEACAWDAEMDATRAAFGTDAPWRGKPARTFKHFVLSPDPGDDIDLAALRELACSWALKHFGDHEIAIVYHDDNARGIPHAHIVVNNANLRTGYRMQTQHPEELRVAPAVALDDGRLEGRPAELRHAELDFPGARDEPPRVVAAAVGLPARRPLVALGPDELGRLLVEQCVERLLDGLPHQILYVVAQRLLVD